MVASADHRPRDDSRDVKEIVRVRRGAGGLMAILIQANTGLLLVGAGQFFHYTQTENI